MDTVVPVCSGDNLENATMQDTGYYTPKGFLNQKIVKEAEAARESKRLESPRYSTTSSEYNIPVSPPSRFPSSSPLIVISPPKDDATPITILPTPVRSSTIPDTHRKSLIVAMVAAFLVFLAVIFMILLIIGA